MSDSPEPGLAGTKRPRVEQRPGQKYKKFGNVYSNQIEKELEYSEEDEAEKQKFAQMSQVERETIIFERDEKQREADEIIELTKNSRPEMSKKELALEDIKRRQVEKAKLKEAEPDSVGEDSVSGFEGEQQGVSEEESVHSDYDDKREPKASYKEPEITLSDVEKVRLSRDILEKWVDQVYFESTVEGCFVRTTVATNKREHKYMMCQIAGVSEDLNNTYKLGKKQTNKLLKLKYGNSVKSISISHVSNSPFTSTEFIQWKAVMNKENIPLVTKSSLISKQEKIKNALDYRYKNDEIDYMLIKNRKERLEKAGENINIALELNEVLGQINYYKQQCNLLDKEKNLKKGNEGQLKKYHEMLKMLKEERMILEELKKKKYNTKQEVDVMQIFNQNARLMQQELDSMAEIKKKDNIGEFNPFSRRNLQPETIWNTKLAVAEPEVKEEVKVIEPKVIVDNTPQTNRDEVRKRELIEKHKEVKINIEVAESKYSSDKNVMIEGIFDLRLEDNEPEDDSRMCDVLSFQEWKAKYTKH
jgi:RNA polymerase-associated protein RTF1